MTVKLSSKLPEKGLDNGLNGLLLELLNQPGEPTIVVAVLTTQKTERNYDTGNIIPTLRVVRIEAMPAGALRGKARELLDAVYTERTGNDTLPYDEDDVGADASE